jgi:hypothetical protein
MRSSSAADALTGLPVRLVGRSVEMDRLRAALDDACGGQARVIALGGPSGVGKSRLMLELAAEARPAGIAVVSVACERDAPSVWPWHAIVRSLIGPAWSAATHAAASAAVEALAIHDGREAPVFAARDLVAAALREAGAERPLAILIDDLHDADPHTLDLLAFVARQLAASPLLVLVAHRDPVPALDLIADVPGVDTIVLHALATEQLRDLITIEAGTTLPAYVVDQIAFVSGGLPRAVRQAVRRLEEAGLLDRATGRWREPSKRDESFAVHRMEVVEEQVFRRSGAVWTLRFAGRDLTIADARGMRDLAELLRRPGEAVHVLELMGAAHAGEHVEPVLDDAARTAYRRRLRELEAELGEAEAANDPGVAERARREIAAIAEAFAGACGLGGRYRAMRSAAERARVAVRRRVAYTILRIERAHPALGEHLRTYVRTGYWCNYQAGVARPVRWEM